MIISTVRVKDAAEVWHYYAGAPLEIRVVDETGVSFSSVLGIDLSLGERPQFVVPAGAWQTSGAVSRTRPAASDGVSSATVPSASTHTAVRCPTASAGAARMSGAEELWAIPAL
jgi:predicted cupin superfamily sugar epimerase